MSGLEVRGLGVSAGDVALTHGIDLDVHPGEVVGLVGASGSGKSVTVRAIPGLLAPGLRALGSVRLDGTELLGDDGGAALRAARGPGLALLLQDPATMLDPLRRCGEQVVAGDPRLAARRLADVGLGDPRIPGRYPFELSGGQRQRVAIAAAVARRPSVLLADEPTSALDPVGAGDVLALLRALRDAHGMGLLLVTHDPGLAFATCDRVHVLHEGAIVESGSPAALARAPRHPFTHALVAAAARRGAASLPIAPPVAPLPLVVARPSAPPPPGATGPCAPPPAAAGPSGLPPATAGPVPAAPPVARVRGLRVRFGEHVALDGVDLEIAAGAATAVVGPSGAGKTTLARCLVRLQAAHGGTVEVGGVPLAPRLPAPARRAVRDTAQLVFQDPASSLNPALRVRTTLREAIALGGPPLRTPEELLDLVGVPAPFALRRPAELSGGERQRVALARALARRPRLLVCDEVVASLDVVVQARVLALLRDLRRELGFALLFISHDLAAVRDLCDDVHVLAAGRVVESGPVERVLAAPRHPVTAGLLAAQPVAATDDTREPAT